MIQVDTNKYQEGDSVLELKVFTEMFSDESVLNFKKMCYKYGAKDFEAFIQTLRQSFLTKLSIKDFKGSPVTILLSKINLTSQLKKKLLSSYENQKYGIKAMEEEIVSTLSIESIDTSRGSVRRILNGEAPNNDSEEKAYGIKRGLDFIADTTNQIIEYNLHKLYMLSVGNYLKGNKRLQEDKFYRHDTVFVIGDDIAHTGLQHILLPEYMKDFISFINTENTLDEVLKSIIIHYYFAYLHPYFDGNGRMARLMQLWYLVQKGYSQALFIPFSGFINESKSVYYKAFEQIAENKKIVGTLDVTPFIMYFIDYVFKKLNKKVMAVDVLNKFDAILANGIVTPKEKELFEFVVSNYGGSEFSTKQLEKDFGNAAYATIRAFVLKFKEQGLIHSQQYGARVKYRIISSIMDDNMRY